MMNHSELVATAVRLHDRLALAHEDLALLLSALVYAGVVEDSEAREVCPSGPVATPAESFLDYVL